MIIILSGPDSALGAVGWLAWRGSPYVYAAAGVAMFLVPPRVSTAYLAFLLPGLLATIQAISARSGVVELNANPQPMSNVQRI